MNSLASRLRQVRTEKQLTQAELAQRAGVGESTVSSIEQGRSRTTTLVVPIAKVLGVREEWLMTGRGRKEAAREVQPDEHYYVAARTPQELAEQLLAHGDEAVLQLLALVMQLKAGKR